MSSRACSSHKTRTVGCERCNALANMYERKRRSAIADGTWLSSVDAADVQAHLNVLAEAGASMASVAAAANVSKRTVLGVRHNKWVTGPTAAALLAVRLEDCRPQVPANMVPAVGAMRRVRGLSWLGWSLQFQADRLGWPQEQVSVVARDRRQALTVVNDRAIRREFELLSGSRGPSVRSHRWAVRKGWLPPLAWNDLDDPDEVPSVPGREVAAGVEIDEIAVVRAVGGDEVRLSRPERLEAVRRLLESGLSQTGAAKRLRLSGSTVAVLAASLAGTSVSAA